jgi:hypothetical protein
MWFFGTALLLLSTRIIVSAETPPPPTLPQTIALFDSSDAVVVAEVISEEQVVATTSTGFTTYRALLRVNKDYQGSLTGAQIAIYYARSSDVTCGVSYCERLRAGEHALFFLRRKDDGFVLHDKFAGKFRVPRLGSWKDTTGIGRDGLKNDLLLLLTAPETDSIAESVIGLLAGFHDPTVIPVLDRHLKENNPKLSAAIQVALLTLGDYRHLKEIASWISVQSADYDFIRWKVAAFGAIETITDSAAVPALIGLTNNASPELRGAAVYALRQIHDRRSVPVLIALLDDPSPEIQYDSLFGLFAAEPDQGSAPSVDNFAQNHAKYIADWKEWWRNVGSAKYSAVHDQR